MIEPVELTIESDGHNWVRATPAEKAKFCNEMELVFDQRGLTAQFIADALHTFFNTSDKEMLSCRLGNMVKIVASVQKNTDKLNALHIEEMIRSTSTRSN